MELDKLFYIPEKEWYELQGWATIAYDEDKNEISGLMTVLEIEPNKYLICNPEILKQENTGTTTELDKDALTDFYVKTAMKHGEDIRFCWWHSHHTMGAFWSTTDEREINAWKNDSWSLALVIIV